MLFRKENKITIKKNKVQDIKNAFLLAACTFMAVSNAHAMDEADNSICNKKAVFSHSECWYVGGGVGQSHIDPTPVPEYLWQRVTDDSDTSLKLFGGVSFSKHWFSEFSFENLGSADINYTSPTYIEDDTTAEYMAWSVTAGYWLRGRTSTWDIYAKAGLAYLQTDDVVTEINAGDSKLPVLGIGAEWRFAEKWFGRLELTHSDEDARTLGLSIARYLGKSSKNNRPQVITPKSVTPKPVTPTPVTPKPAPAQKVTAKKINPDLDADGVINEQDKCPSSPAGSNVDTRGCPLLQTVTLSVQFDTSRAFIKDEFIAEINEVSEAIKKMGNVHVTVEGHTDWQGKQVNNQPLSESRAAAVAKLLTERTGLKSSNFSVIGYGELKPIADNTTPDGRYKNRRVVVVISEE